MARRRELLDECYRAGTAVITVTTRIAGLLDLDRLREARTCGSCGCLCRADEACPSCRFRLTGPTC